MPSSRFKKIISDLGTMGDTCTIKMSKNKVTFAVKGEEISGSTTVKPTDTVDAKNKEGVVITSKDDVSLSFAMKYLSIFAKAHSLVDDVTLSLSTEAPLMVEYSLENLGHIRYYLAPKIDDEDKKDD